MGQYYRAVIETDGAEMPVVVNPWNFPRLIHGEPFGEGQKLVEHSSVEGKAPASSLTVACAMGLLSDAGRKGARVWWMGDYADDIIDRDDRDTWDAFYAAWKNGPSKRTSGEVTGEECERACTGYLVDLDRHTFVDVAASCNGADTESHWVFHPLPLLTAVGNGQGSGDYRSGDDRDLDPEGLVGSWAGHRVAWVREAPEAMAQTACVFAIEVQKPRWA